MKLTLPLRGLVAVAIAVVAVAQGPLPCGVVSASTVPPYRFVDACGRQVVFRGVNKVNKSPPYYPSPTVFSPGASATPADAALWQSLGFNLIRLGVMMTGTMPLPSPSAVNATYLGAIVNVTRALASRGVFTLADFHQDLLSPAFCADGIPVWAAQRYSAGAPGFPIPLTSTPYPVDNATGTPTGESTHGRWLHFPTLSMQHAHCRGTRRLWPVCLGRLLLCRGGGAWVPVHVHPARRVG